VKESYIIGIKTNKKIQELKQKFIDITETKIWEGVKQKFTDIKFVHDVKSICFIIFCRVLT